jgi:hypothetical protein
MASAPPSLLRILVLSGYLRLSARVSYYNLLRSKGDRNSNLLVAFREYRNYVLLTQTPPGVHEVLNSRLSRLHIVEQRKWLYSKDDRH